MFIQRKRVSTPESESPTTIKEIKKEKKEKKIKKEYIEEPESIEPPSEEAGEEKV